MSQGKSKKKQGKSAPDAPNVAPNGAATEPSFDAATKEWSAITDLTESADSPVDPEALEKAEASQRVDYAGIARANLAWLAWRIGDLPAARQEGTVALENWQEAGTGTPFRWLALWPLIGAALKESSLAQAVTYAAMLLDVTQQPQPQTIHERLESAFNAWQAGHGVQALAHLDAAAAIAASRGYL